MTMHERTVHPRKQSVTRNCVGARSIVEHPFGTLTDDEVNVVRRGRTMAAGYSMAAAHATYDEDRDKEEKPNIENASQLTHINETGITRTNVTYRDRDVGTRASTRKKRPHLYPRRRPPPLQQQHVRPATSQLRQRRVAGATMEVVTPPQE